MSPRVLITVCLFAVLSPMTTEQPAWGQESVPEELGQAFEAGDARALGRMMAPAVDISLFGARKRYSRNQARLLMASFFSSWPAAGFEVVTYTRTTSGWFVEARYHTTRPGSPLRLFLRMRRHDSVWLVRELIMEAPEHEDP